MRYMRINNKRSCFVANFNGWMASWLTGRIHKREDEIRYSEPIKSSYSLMSLLFIIRFWKTLMLLLVLGFYCCKLYRKNGRTMRINSYLSRYFQICMVKNHVRNQFNRYFGCCDSLISTREKKTQFFCLFTIFMLTVLLHFSRNGE